jgi:hypothetical protein
MIDDPPIENHSASDRTTATDELLSQMYHSLRAPRRRMVIRIFGERESEQLSTRELARRIAGKECDTSPENATGEPYRNVYNALSQTHLPTLSDALVVIYDSERQTVAPGQCLPIATVLLSIDESAVQALEPFSGPDSRQDRETGSTTD